VKRFKLQYSIPSEGITNKEFSWNGETEEAAREGAVEKLADLNFTTPDKVELGVTLGVGSISGETYYECEGCSA
jgi:hypothetical protein